MLAMRIRKEARTERRLQAILRDALERPTLQSPRLAAVLLVESLLQEGTTVELAEAVALVERLPASAGDLRGSSHRTWRSRVIKLAQDRLSAARRTPPANDVREAGP